MSEAVVAFGLSWMVVGALVGFYVGHQHDSLAQRLDAIGNGGSLIDYHRAHDAYRRRVTLHAHSFLFPVVTTIIGIVMPRIAFPESGIATIGVALVVAAPTWTLGAMRWFKPLMALGDVLLLGAVAATAIGVTRGL